jgi:alkylation response protein AidB-like acyl-CoA dehydrogenase
MSTYTPPLKDMQFLMREIAGIDEISQLPGFEEASADVVDAILEEAGKFAGGVLAPLNWSGDQEGAKFANKQATTPAGFKEAYQQFIANGWNGLGCHPEFGGQGMPKLVNAAVCEMWRSANISFALCPMLTMGAVEALELAGSDELKNIYLPKMISGDWTGTMNLTEPQAGSDLAAVRSRAEPQGDGSYKIFGQKIFITYGDHDMAENTIHLVLARLPDAPEGVKGISLFIVPKFMVKADGSLGERNDAWCVSIEHKLGIHASPTCVMAFGDNGGAVGYLVGQANEGLKYMFVMMNAARFFVGIEGLGLAEAAYQKAVTFSRDRVQGRAIEGSPAPVAIIKHPDIRRMLMEMRSRVEAMRAISFWSAGIHDRGVKHPDADERKRLTALAEFMTPIVKAWLTETGNEMTYLGVQIHGGMGFIEETGAAQFMRDARITTIYEGTTGIQALDLIGRKTARDGGATLKALLAMMDDTLAELGKQSGADFARLAQALKEGIDAAGKAGTFVAEGLGKTPREVAAGAVPYLRLMGLVCGGWLLARSALVAQAKIAGGDTDPFYAAKIQTAHYFADHAMTAISGFAAEVVAGGESTLALDDAMF